MGGVADTSVFIAYERKGWNAQRSLAHLASIYSDKIVLPSIASVELIQGIYRAQTPEQAERRRTFVLHLVQTLTIIPFTQQAAWIAGQIRGEQAAQGNTLPFADSLIAATAMQLNYDVLTTNVKDMSASLASESSRSRGPKTESPAPSPC